MSHSFLAYRSWLRWDVEWDAASYHRLSGPQVGWGEKVLDRLELRGDETVLDAGCGTGRLTAQLLERLPRGTVIAVDQSENMLETASEHLLPRFDGHVSFLHADLAELELDAVADVIFSTATLHWVTDHPRLFRRLYRALKLGGRLLAQCGGGPNLAHLLERARTLMDSPPFTPAFSSWTGPWEFADPSIAAERLSAAGFVDVWTGLEPAPIVLGGDEEYRDFLRTVIFRLHLERLGDETLQEEFLNRLTAEGARDTPAFLLDYWRLNLSARRPELVGQGA